MQNHNISFVEASETKNDVLNANTDDENTKDNVESAINTMIGII